MTAARLPFETVTVIELIVAESLWTSAHLEIFGDGAAGVRLYQPCRSVAAVELVRGAYGDEPTVAGLLEGVEVPVGILNIWPVDLVPLRGTSRICFDERGSFGVDGILEVVASERVPSVRGLLRPSMFRSLMSPVGRMVSANCGFPVESIFNRIG